MRCWPHTPTRRDGTLAPAPRRPARDRDRHGRRQDLRDRRPCGSLSAGRQARGRAQGRTDGATTTTRPGSPRACRGSPVRTALRYEAPVAPAVAARLEGAPEPSLEPIVAAARELRAAPTASSSRAPGALLVPISRRETFAEVALALDLPLLIVARPGLGTLNHTALTVEVARARGIAVAGVVVCGTNADPDVAERTNLDRAGAASRPLLGTLPLRPRWLARARYGLGVIDLQAIEESVLGRGEPLAREDAMRITALSARSRPRVVRARPPRAARALRGGGLGRVDRVGQDGRLQRGLRVLLAVGALPDARARGLAGRRRHGGGGPPLAGRRSDRVLHRRGVRGPDERLLSRTLEAAAAIKRETGCRSPARWACSTTSRRGGSPRAASTATTTTSRRLVPSSPAICTSHSFDDRYETCLRSREAGMELCSGGIVGMGETLGAARRARLRPRLARSGRGAAELPQPPPRYAARATRADRATRGAQGDRALPPRAAARDAALCRRPGGHVRASCRPSGSSRASTP